MSKPNERKLTKVDFRRASQFLSIGCITSGLLVGFFATYLLIGFQETISEHERNLGLLPHESMTFQWTVGSLGGIGLIIGTVMGLLFNAILSRFGEPNASTDLEH